jgi:hypothetical protein
MAFLARARPVLQLCEQAQSLLAEGVWVVCTDEKTSIQARQRDEGIRFISRPATSARELCSSPLD